MTIQAKKQLWFIGGGEAFDSREAYLDNLRNYPYEIGTRGGYDWKSWVSAGLASTYNTIKPDFPARQYADYEAWKIWFEKYIEKYITPESQIDMIAHSLGVIFITKYLSENILPVKINTLHLVAGVFDNEGLSGETIGNFGFDPTTLILLEHQVDTTHIWASEDDTIVPFSHSLRYAEHLPGSILHTFSDRGHFVDQSHFIELFTTFID